MKSFSCFKFPSYEHAGRPRKNDEIKFNADLDEIERVADEPTTDSIVRQRAGILMDSNSDMPNTEIAEHMKVSVHMVAYWRKRYLKDGATCIYGHKGKPKKFSPNDYQRLMDILITQERGLGRKWTLISLAQKTGISKSQIGRLFKQKNIRISDSNEEIMRKWNAEPLPKTAPAQPADERARRSDGRKPSR